MPDGQEESSPSYTVATNYQAAWARKAGTTLAIGAVLIILGVVGLIAGVGSAAVALVVGLLAGGAGLLIRHGVTTTRRHRYALTVAPDRLVVTWRDQVTELPWAELTGGLVVANGPWMRTLEVTPRPGVRPVLPRNARPRPSKQRPDNLDVFILSVLGERENEAVAAVSRHLPMR